MDNLAVKWKPIGTRTKKFREADATMLDFCRNYPSFV